MPLSSLPSARALTHGLKPAPLICYGCYAILAALCLGVIFFPYQTFGALANFIGLFGAGLGVLRLAASATPLAAEHNMPTHKNMQELKYGRATSQNEVWPFYTVFVPIYKEARIVPHLMNNLAQLDYPRDRLEIMMVCEADDIATVNAVKHALRPPFKLVPIAPSGEIVTIYDAEDRPHPQQLKMAARRLMDNPKLGAVQAPLDYYNNSVNWLTRQFALEYAFLFRVWPYSPLRTGYNRRLGCL